MKPLIHEQSSSIKLEFKFPPKGKNAIMIIGSRRKKYKWGNRGIVLISKTTSMKISDRLVLSLVSGFFCV